MENFPHLELYYFDSCPYCQKVMRVIEKLSIDLVYNDIYSDSKHREKLIQDTGRKTVPCLYIDSNPMHESDEIVKWLEANQNKLKKR